MKLKDRIAIITGASEGIGAAIAREFVLEGARLTLAARSADKLDRLAGELGTENALAVPTDVTDPAQVRRMVAQTVERYGRLDILVNNAGMGLYSAIESLEPERNRKLWELNFFAAIDCAQAALPHLRPAGGTVVNISSTAGKISLPLMGAYCATKSALNAVSTAMRMELKRSGVHVATVCPGFVDTGFSDNADGQTPNRMYSTVRRGVPARRVARTVVKAIVARKNEVVVPAYYRVGIFMRNLLPRLGDAMIARAAR